MNSNQQTTKLSAVLWKLDILKQELDHIQQAIGRLDHMCRAQKNWCVIVWGGSLALSLKDGGLGHIVFLTALLPVPFWFVDGWLRSIQRRFVFRVGQIGRFINGDNFEASLESKNFRFWVYDPRAKLTRDAVNQSSRKTLRPVISEEDPPISKKDIESFPKTTSIKKTLFFAEVWVFYLSLIVISVVVGSVDALVG